MKEILITSSILILALLLLRQLFRNVLSRRIQYALWGLVLVRLLVPVSLPAADFSVLTAARPVQSAVTERLDRAVTPAQPAPAQDGTGGSAPDPGRDDGSLPQTGEPGQLPAAAQPASGLTAGEVLRLIWIAGMAVMGAFFLVSNGAFYGRLRKNREEWRAEGGPPHMALPHGFPRKVYLVPDGVIPSPCLFGRSIYITPAAARDPARLRHVLCHEGTHARHLDPLWSFLRCVCLTVYWFDPLVWAAARCSKTDCELACDESVLKTLGEEERLPYGQTLLSLIPVTRGANPLLAATTMAAGKRQLKDRITRIAKGPRQLGAAALAAALLAGILAACAFTGAKDPDGALRSLTGEELRWFNEEFFNSSAVQPRNSTPYASGPEGDTYYNLCNQFANLVNLYEKPQDIDLYELFYCEPGESMNDEELKAAFGADAWEDLPCGAYKLSAERMDAMLQACTGLGLEATNKVGLEHFTYLEEYDAYYWAHGDTNYPGEIEILSGTREGALVTLYHSGWSAGSPGIKTTLEQQEDGSYHFLSNVACEVPSIPAPLPDWEPAARVSYGELESYAPYELPSEPRAGADRGDDRLVHTRYDAGHVLQVYRSAQDGRVYAGIEQPDGTLAVFFSTAGPDCRAKFYPEIFGRENVLALGYDDEASGPDRSAWTYFDLNDPQHPICLASVLQTGGTEPQVLDLNGDGWSEIITWGELIFKRPDLLLGRLEWEALMERTCPEMERLLDVTVDRYGKAVILHGRTLDYEDCVRCLYMDGPEELLLYKDETPTDRHKAAGAS